MTIRRKTIVTVLTPSGRAAIATIAVDGPGAEQLVLRFFQPVGASSLPLGRIRFGRWGGCRGEELVVCQRQLDRVEIHCHGGRIASAAIVNDLVREGAELVEWNEWLDLQLPSRVQAEAHQALTRATTLRTASCLLDQYRGALTNAVRLIVELLEKGDRAKAVQAARGLRHTANVGLHLTSPWRIVIVGPPNVGKSSLMNALVGYDRAIVHAQAGTTRDILSASIAIDGWPFELVDTAGLREAADPIEQEGNRRAIAASEHADLVLRIVDAISRSSDSMPPETRTLGTLPTTMTLVNKCDLLSESDRHELDPGGNRSRFDAYVSALTAEGLPQLMGQIVARLVPTPPAAGDAILFTQRQVQRIDKVLQFIARDQVPMATASLQAFDAQAET